MSHHHVQKKNPDAPMTNVCIYRVKEGKEAEFKVLLGKHWPALRKAGLATAEPAKFYRTIDRKQRVCYVEIFSWVNAEGPETAHKTPGVMQVWEPMGAILDDMEFLSTDD